MSSTLGVRQWFPTEPGDLAREFGISFVGDDDEEEVVKKECVSPPTLPPIPPLIPLRSVSEDSAAAYGGVFMVNSDGPFGEEPFQVPVSDCCARGEDACTVVLDPLPNDLLRSLTEEGQISAEKWDPQTLPLDQCRRNSSESAVRGLLRDLVSTVATSEGEDESLLQRPLDSAPIDDEDDDDYDLEEEEEEEGGQRPRKAVRRRHERRSSSSGGKSKRRKRSTSCSTTSSTGSATSRHHHHKHRKHRRRKSKNSADELDNIPTPRVNPIFVWVKQDDTRIVEVLCEDYDKRNRIRIKRTAQGWRAIPRTERLASAGSVTATPTSSTNCPPGVAPQCTVTSSLVSNDANPIEEEEEEDPSTKENFDEIEEENEIEACFQEVEGYPEIEQPEEELLEEDPYEPSDAVQDQICTDSEMEPTDLSIPKTTFGEIEIIPLKGINPILPAAPPPIHSPATIEPIPPSPLARPAHQPKPQHKSMFLESLLSSPRKCHPVTKVEQTSEEFQPLDLGMSLIRSSGSPTVSSCSEERKPPPPPEPDLKPKVKRLKVEDITLKNLLNKTVALDKERKTPTEILLDSSKSQKSRLLELLTSEPAPASQVTLDQDLNPLTQLKKILSDPELSVPDPLLVPRDRLHSLITCPAREIPHLLSVRPELRLPDALAYPVLVRDPDLLVVSLTHLQRLLEKPEADTGNYITLRDWQRYQTELIESQLKQQQQHHQHQNRNGGDLPADLDAGTAAALNQLFWLPYLTQLEATAMACGNNQEFLTMLNAVFPPTNFPQVQGGSASFLPPFTVPPTDLKTQMELQQTLALWQEAMVQATVTASSVNNNNSTSNNNNLLPGKNISGTNNYNKSHHSSNGRYPHLAKKLNSSSARTSPISPNFQHAQHQQRSATNNQQYLSTNGYNHHHQYNQQRTHLQQPVRNSSGPQRPLKSEIQTPMDTDRLSNNNVMPKPKVTCKSLIHLLSNTRKQEQQHQEPATIKKCPTTPTLQQQQHSHLLAALGNPPGNMPHLVPITQESAHTPTNNPIDLSGRARSKLKVKQHLVDPAITPRLLKQDADKVAHPQLWHPLFGSSFSEDELQQPLELDDCDGERGVTRMRLR